MLISNFWSFSECELCTNALIVERILSDGNLKERQFQSNIMNITTINGTIANNTKNYHFKIDCS